MDTQSQDTKLCLLGCHFHSIPATPAVEVRAGSLRMEGVVLQGPCLLVAWCCSLTLLLLIACTLARCKRVSSCCCLHAPELLSVPASNASTEDNRSKTLLPFSALCTLLAFGMSHAWQNTAFVTCQCLLIWALLAHMQAARSQTVQWGCQYSRPQQVWSSTMTSASINWALQWTKALCATTFFGATWTPTSRRLQTYLTVHLPAALRM